MNDCQIHAYVMVAPGVVQCLDCGGFAHMAPGPGAAAARDDIQGLDWERLRGPGRPPESLPRWATYEQLPYLITR